MMLRIIFTGLATCVLLLAAGVRFAREDAPPDVRRELGSALEQAIETAKEALTRRPAQRASLEPAAKPPAPAPSTAASRIPPPPASKPTPPTEQTATRPPEPPAGEAESVTEEWIDPLWSAPFVEAPEAGLGGVREENSEQQEQQAPFLAATPSQDEWAGLIRRMLAIYQRVGAAE